MRDEIILLGISGSNLAGDVAARLERGGVPSRALSLDAPLEGKAVSVLRGEVKWEDASLLDARLVFVERLVFPWPQVGLPSEPLREDAEYRRWVNRRREAMSLAWSAVMTVAETRPVLNPPAASHIAVSPPIALDRLSRSGIRVHPWRVEPLSSPLLRGRAIVTDASGRDRWHSPSRPRQGEPVLVYEPFSGGVVTVLVVGSEIVGSLRFDNGAVWAANREAPAVAGPQGAAGTPGRPSSIGPDAARLAIDAVSVLGLFFAEVSILERERESSLLCFDAAPDLAWWSRGLGGRLAPVLADHLAKAASRDEPARHKESA